MSKRDIDIVIDVFKIRLEKRVSEIDDLSIISFENLVSMGLEEMKEFLKILKRK